MTQPISFQIDSTIYGKCKKLVDEKEFKSDSEAIEFAIRLYYYQIRINGIRPKLLNHDRAIKKSVRINETIIEYIVKTGFFKKVELADYALDYLIECRSKFDKRRNIFEEDS